MINYAKHDEEFHCVIKLVNGEEILGRAILTEDDGESLIFISAPVMVQTVMKELDDGRVVKAMGFANWMQMSDEDFYILREKDVLAVASMSREVIFMYEAYISDDDGDEDDERHAVADTALSHLLTEPHDERTARGEGQYRHQAEAKGSRVVYDGSRRALGIQVLKVHGDEEALYD